MAVHFKVLVQPGRDNPLYVTVDIGQSLHRLLFDCGEGVLASLPVVDVQQIEALFFWQFQARLFWLSSENEIKDAQ